MAADLKLARVHLLFLAPGDVSKGRVEPISWMRTCEAFASQGVEVCLVVLRIRRPDGIAPTEVWRHFGIPELFRIKVLPTPLRHASSVRSFRLWAGLATSLLALALTLQQAFRPQRLIIYSRTPIMVLPFIALSRLLPRSRRPAIVFETHTLPNRFGALVLRHVDLVVVTSRRLRRDLTRIHGTSAESTLLSPLGPFNEIRPLDRDEARERLGLPKHVPLAVYTGKLIEEQNDFLLETGRALSERVPGATLMLVGGNPRILDWTRREIVVRGLDQCVMLAGFVDPALINTYQAAADVLVFHMADSLSHWEYCTPAKAFEYQAARRPVVATDLPLFDEVFGQPGQRAIKAVDRTPACLADAIREALTREDQSAEMAERAAAWVAQRTWTARSKAVLDALPL